MTQFAFVFPGQGSQSVGMLDAWGDHPAVRELRECIKAQAELGVQAELEARVDELERMLEAGAGAVGR